MYDINEVKAVDPEICEAINEELYRQQHNIELIASENIVSKAVMAGSVLTNKYAEGYPGKRYYGGCEKVDIVEELARKRACELFGAEHANVQPHSGAQANMAVFFAVLKPGDTVMGMSLAHGGHLTHGSPVNMSGKQYNVVSYGVSEETGRIDYEEFRRVALENKPKLIIAGASAYSRTIDFEFMSKVAKEVGAYFMVDMAHIAGLVAAGLHPNPVPYADFVTTTTHKTLEAVLFFVRKKMPSLLTRLFFLVFRVVLLCMLLQLRLFVSRKLLTQVSRSMLNRLLRMQRYLLTDLLKMVLI